ncbi:hypothetical protein MPER_09956, partial [Moniliophthora perniciosa FA553]
TDSFVDYTRLKQLCRQKVDSRAMKQLTIRGDLKLLDLTDDLKPIGDFPVAGGAYSDLGQGEWFDPVEKKAKLIFNRWYVPRQVAVKYLRQVLFTNAQDKLLKRLQAEILVWHQLAHRNVAPLYGLVQNSKGIGMVSLWYNNGTLYQYMQDRPHVNKLALIVQIAQGLSYLHNFTPSIVHGDLKASNILVDAEGQAVITDFGLSGVKDLSRSFTSVRHLQPASSFLGGSTRWMAPELFLYESESNWIGVTTASDVFAFASTCLEIITGKIPYSCYQQDSTVMLKIVQGVKTSSRRVT